MNAYWMAFVSVFFFHSDGGKLCDREVLQKLVKNVNTFINEMKSVGDDDAKANNDEELDINDFAREEVER